MRRDTPLRRGNPPARKTRLKPVSAKRRGIASERNETRQRVLERDLGLCQIKREGCSRWATDVHEILTRARGGSIVDDANCVSACRSCHRYVTEHPAWAHENGWMRHSWESTT